MSSDEAFDYGAMGYDPKNWKISVLEVTLILLLIREWADV